MAMSSNGAQVARFTPPPPHPLCPMILDHLSNAGQYAHLHPRLAKAFEFLARPDLATMEAGKYPLDGDLIYAMVQDYESRPMEKIIWEAHRKYHDVQFVVTGEERMGWANIHRMTETTPFSAEKDVAFFAGKGNYFALPQGFFIILAPQDVHAPGLALEQPAPVRKVVVKVALGA
jgi:YhcH/YjgK/YiaL family protein